MKSQTQRAVKRRKREDRPSKKTTWYCAGCKDRHPMGTKCPVPRLFAKMTNRMNAK